MPWLIVLDEFPPRLIEPKLVIPMVLGNGSDATESTWAPVTGVGLRLALPLFLTPPWISMDAALTWALPLAESAEDELEST